MHLNTYDISARAAARCLAVLDVPGCSMSIFMQDSRRWCGAAMNELTWRKVQQWEALHPETQSEATLLRFCGRPDNLRCPPAPSFLPWGPKPH